MRNRVAAALLTGLLALGAAACEGGDVDDDGLGGEPGVDGLGDVDDGTGDL